MTEEQTSAAETSLPPRWSLSRQRVIELLVVVFGVLIALGLENVVQELRWRAEARDLERLFRADLSSSMSRALERLAVDPCLAERLQVLASQADNPTGEYRPQVYASTIAMRASSRLPTAYSAPLRLWPTASFDRALGSEAAKRIPQDRLLQYATVFATVAVTRDAQDEEATATFALQPLAIGHPDFNAEVRAQVLGDIAVADGARIKMLTATRRLIERAEALGIQPDPAWLNEALNQQRLSRGVCVDLDGAAKYLASGPQG